MPGVFYRSHDGFAAFEEGPTALTPTMRHTAMKLDGHTLLVFYSSDRSVPVLFEDKLLAVLVMNSRRPLHLSRDEQALSEIRGICGRSW
jgi:hypothetical protein